MKKLILILLVVLFTLPLVVSAQNSNGNGCGIYVGLYKQDKLSLNSVPEECRELLQQATPLEEIVFELNIPAGCYFLGVWGKDFYYNGIPNELNNIIGYSSTDGTCSGTLINDGDFAFVMLEGDVREAQALCESIGPVTGPSIVTDIGDYDYVWFCE